MPRNEEGNALSVISEKTEEEKEVEHDAVRTARRAAHMAGDSIPDGSHKETRRSHQPTARPRESRFFSHLGSPILREPGWQQLSPDPIRSTFSDDEEDSDEINFRTLEWWQAGMSQWLLVNKGMLAISD